MFEMGGAPLDEIELENFILEAGEHPVFEVPDNLSTLGSELSTSRKFSEQSLSSDRMDIE